jgi:hypothetical protein
MPPADVGAIGRDDRLGLVSVQDKILRTDKIRPAASQSPALVITNCTLT